jgi:hypothetical protein
MVTKIILPFISFHHLAILHLYLTQL